MTSLAGQIDRFSLNTKAIKATAATTAISHNKQPPFTSAVLSAHLGDLIRDIDPSELGLFSLINPTPSNFREQNAQGAHITEVTRVDIPAPTPLRKPRDIPKQNDIEPEIYAQAALKYIGRYQTIRPMPRAHSQVIEILQRLDVVRTSIKDLSDTLHHQTQSTGNLPSKKLAEDENKYLHKLQSRATVLKKRKRNALAQQKTPSQTRKDDMSIHKVATPASSYEDKFWNTPAANARTLRFTDNLMDEEMEVGDTSPLLLKGRKPSSTPPSRSAAQYCDAEDSHDLTHSFDYMTLQPSGDDAVEPDHSMVSRHTAEDEENESERLDVLDSEDDNPAAPILRSDSPSALVPVSDSDLLLPIHRTTLADPVNTKIKVNSEIERIVAKIWATVGELIMPGHPFDTNTANNKPPRGKETIIHLHSLSTLSPSPVSPSSSSISAASNTTSAPPTSQQTLTAHLLLLLLASPPHFSMPLNKTKDILALKARAGSSSISTGQGATRVIYGCVAKRLIKIERGGGEQIVRFDI